MGESISLERLLAVFGQESVMAHKAHRRASILRALRLAAAAAILLAATPIWAAEEFTEIPVILNIYKNAGITEAAAKKAIEEANKTLKKVGAKLVVQAANVKPDTNLPGDDGDGKYTKDERDLIRREGQKEVDKLKGKKGMKITFGTDPQAENPTNPGISVHRNPTIIVKNRADDAKTGATIAHEVLHVLTLSEKYTIGGTTESDDHGHAPNIPGANGNDNIMAPSNRRTGTEVTPKQIEKIKKDGMLGKLGRSVKQPASGTPAEKKDEQSGLKTDGIGDVGAAPGYLDIDRFAITSTFTGTHTDMLLTLGSTFPDLVPFDARYLIKLNPPAGMVEIDVQIQRTTPAGPLTSLATLSHYFGGPVTSIDITSYLSILEGAVGLDVDAPRMVESNQLGINLPTSLLALPPDTTPISMMVDTMDGFTLIDDMSLIYDRNSWNTTPTLSITDPDSWAGEGDTVNFLLTGMPAGGLIHLMLDDWDLISFTVDSLGMYAGSFVMPPLGPTPDSFYFLTALLDTSGSSDPMSDANYAFTMVNVPEPGSLLLLSAGALGLLVRRRRAA
jgi:hypothetical protein